MGVYKINPDSDLHLAMTASICGFMVLSPGNFGPREYLRPAREDIKQMAKHKIKNVLNASNQL